MYLERGEPVRDEPVPALLVREVDQARGGDDAGDVAQGHRDDAHCRHADTQTVSVRDVDARRATRGESSLFLKRMQTKL